jgi:uncharacterized membrane protein YfcA
MFLALGFAIGAIGTLIGVGGGVVLVPLLLHLYPDKPTYWIGGITMGMIAVNATSGSITYWRRGKIHMKAALVFVIAGIPGGILGVLAEHHVNRSMFENIFGGAMMLFAVALWLKPEKSEASQVGAESDLNRKFYVQGGLLSLVIGFVSSFLSIGGGVFHVPALTHVLGFPVHMATGTSHFVLGCTAWIALATHLWNQDISLSEPILWQLALGAAVGAQLGAYLSVKVTGNTILRLLSVVLALVGLRLVFN